ncbi:MAG: hypothetical protein GXX95_10175 [Methanomassiliicoccus sp.]|nr:hypothetical protein [Methanomassiliicoccus sp.]
MKRVALIVEGFQRSMPGQAEQLLKWYWGAVSGMRDILRRDYGYSPENTILMFQDMNAGPDISMLSTKVNVEKELSRLASTLEEDDELFCFFVDHGHFDGSSSHFQLQDGTITDTRMNELAGKIRARSQVWVFTQCQSGGFAEKMGAPGRIVMSSTMRSENNREAFAEPCRDALAWPAGKEAPPSVVQSYEAALENVWRIFREGQRRGEPLQEHCLLNVGSKAEYGKHFKLSSINGAIAVPGQEFHIRFPVVSADNPQIKEGTTILVRYEILNPTPREIRFGPAGVFVACRGPGDENRDFGHVPNLAISPRASFLFEARTKLDKTGQWSFWPAFQKDGRWGPKLFETRVPVPVSLPLSDAYQRKLGDRKNLSSVSSGGRTLSLNAYWPYHTERRPRAGDEITFMLLGVEGMKGGYLTMTGPGKGLRVELRPYAVAGIGTALEGTTSPLTAGDWNLDAFADSGRGMTGAGIKTQLTVG